MDDWAIQTSQIDPVKYSNDSQTLAFQLMIWPTDRDELQIIFDTNQASDTPRSNRERTCIWSIEPLLT